MTIGERAARWSLEEFKRWNGARPSAERVAQYFEPAVRDQGGRRFHVGMTAGNYCAAGACFAAAQVVGSDELERAGLPHAYRVSGLELEQDAQKHSAWIERAQAAAAPDLLRPGDLVILQRGDPKAWTKHVGRIVHRNADALTCIDANAGGAAWKVVTRPINGPTVRGFVRYPDGITLADDGKDLGALVAMLCALGLLA